jgi:hypothetical protein
MPPLSDKDEYILYELYWEALGQDISTLKRCKQLNKCAPLNKKNIITPLFSFGITVKECVPHTTIHMIHAELKILCEK